MSKDQNINKNYFLCKFKSWSSFRFFFVENFGYIFEDKIDTFTKCKVGKFLDCFLKLRLQINFNFFFNQLEDMFFSEYFNFKR